ncbi:unnamed protein product [Rangifer tarandus platyrhynchus]|uniref:Uncharacterized protein n=1 Tax=Rangifer tarandus platyrhynchus TaxID=3082113 RepID=A0ABN8ZU34_RANTA|nr:unnamed protein product [Rangifer tarandus platyrhynchus]
MATPIQGPPGHSPRLSNLPLFWLGNAPQFSTSAASISPPPYPPSFQTTQHNSSKDVFSQNKSQEGEDGFWVLGNSSLQLRLTQQHKGLWEQNKCTNAGLPPTLGARLPAAGRAGAWE